MPDDYIEIKIRFKQSIIDKIEKIVQYINLREKLLNTERKSTQVTIEEFIRGSSVQMIEKIETYNHLITYDGDKSLGSKNLILKNRIKEILKEKKMTQLDLCELTGIDRASMSFIVNNRNQPNADSLLKIWVALDFYPLEEIFYRVES